MNDSKIIALISSISQDNALQYGSVGIASITHTPNGSGIRFVFPDDNYSDVPISNMSFMFKNTYDANNNGLVDKTETVQLNSTSTKYYTGDQLLDRKNHTGTQDSATVVIDKSNLKEFFNDFTGSTIQDMVNYFRYT